jgi:hypothetical protein
MSRKTPWCCSRWGATVIDGLHTCRAGQLRQDRTGTKSGISNPSTSTPNGIQVLLHCTKAICIKAVPNTTPSLSASIKMAPPTDRKEILAAFRKQIDSGTAIVGAGAGMQDTCQNPGCPNHRCSPLFFSGIGLTAKSAEAGGISLIIIYNRYLSAHVPSCVVYPVN